MDCSADSFDKKYLKFINGNYDEQRSTTIRVFIISTCAEDYELERSFIIKYVLKDLKDKYDDIIVCLFVEIVSHRIKPSFFF